MFDLMNLENTTKQVEFHKSCKFVCKINSRVCSEKQRFNKNKCRCECLTNKKCQNDFVWNYSNCECEYRKSAKLIVEEECDVETNDIIQNKTISGNSKNLIIIKNRKLLTICCFKYFICVSFNNIVWNYDLFLC